jgi:hypothetical protein
MRTSALGTAHFMFADVGEGAAAGAAIVEVSAALVHLGEFLAHQADDLHAKQRLGSHEFEEGGSRDKLESAVTLAVSAECVWRRAEGCRKSDDAAGTEETLEDFAAVVGDDGGTCEAVHDDIDSPAFRALPHDYVVTQRGNGFGKRFQRHQELWR